MNVKSLLPLLLIILSQPAFAQITPLKYNAPLPLANAKQTISPNLYSALMSTSTKQNKQGIKDSLHRLAKYGFYKKLADTFGIIADRKVKTADKAFQDSLTALPIPVDAANLDTYNTQKNILDSKHNSAILEAGKFRNEQKTFDYLFRTTGRFNNIFQKGGFVKDASDAQMFYNSVISTTKYSLMSTSALSFGSNGSTASIYNELYADYFGPFRVGIGVLLNNQSTDNGDGGKPIDTTKMRNDAIQKLIGGGGNGVFNIYYPLVSFQDASNAFNVKVYASPKVCANIPKIGTSTNNPAYNYDLGGELGMYYSGVLDAITFYTHLRTGYVGGSSEFYAGLDKPDNKAFMLNQFSVGIAVTKVFTVSWNTFFGDSYVKRNFQNSLSVSINTN